MVYAKHFKRIFDLVASILAIPFTLLIILIFAPLIFFEDRGNVFYSAPRTGLNGKVFIMHKLRTMSANAPDIRNEDGSTFSSPDDPRVTRIGRILRVTSLDEIPQIFNVLLGEMSMVGPRPTLATILYENLNEVQKKRLTVRPGLTGYSQALFRNAVCTEKKFLHDIFYIDNISLKLDFQIILLTFRTVIKKEKIFTSDSRGSTSQREKTRHEGGEHEDEALFNKNNDTRSF